MAAGTAARSKSAAFQRTSQLIERCASDWESRWSCYEASMTLARLADVLAPARASGMGLGGNVFSIEHAEAFTAAAEAAETAVVLQRSCSYGTTVGSTSRPG